MPKYRRLTLQELEPLEQEFVEYLVLNGIAADDWEKMKAESPEKASRIVDLFSDVVFEKILRTTRFIEYRSKSKLLAYQCLEDKMVCVGMTVPENAAFDFRDTTMINRAAQSPPAGLGVFTKDIAYEQPREAVLFRLLSNGFEISDGHLFKTLCLVL